VTAAEINLIVSIGVIMAALGMETTSGDFEVIDICFAGLPDLASPEAGPSGTNGVNGKGKGKAKEEKMDIDREFTNVTVSDLAELA
jgi:DNA polymerase delta subunit 2